MKIEMGGNNFDTTIYRKKRREKNIVDKKEITRKRKNKTIIRFVTGSDVGNQKSLDPPNTKKVKI